MEKLLHERLRDWEDNGDGTVSFMALGGKAKITVSGRYDANALADEIERYYIPRPRFEDGEPVQLMDKFEMENGRLCPVTSIGISTGGLRVNPCADSEMAQVVIKDGEFVKRPTPKVYDADGVEIKVGDTVWSSMYGDNSFTVERISKNPKGEPLVMVEEMGSGLFPATCYHEKPVFDAEGVRICKGDTVWPNYGAYADVKSHVLDVFGQDNVLVAVGGAGYERFDGKYLTHREPDSLEKLRDFALEWSHFDNVSNSSAGDFRDAMQEVTDRLTSLIERGA